MKPITPFLWVIAAAGCADVAEPVDARDATFLGLGKADGTTIEEGSTDACSVLAVANQATLAALDDEAGLDGRAASGIVAARPFTTLAALDAVAYVGPVAFDRLLAYAGTAGLACGAATGPTTPATPVCTATGGTYDGVRFTAAAECKALAFLDGARMSDLRTLPDTARNAAYDHCAAGAACSGYHYGAWTSVGEFSAWPKIGAAAMKAVATAAAAWKAGPSYDTVADVWARRSDLKDAPVTFEKVYVTRGGIQESGSYGYVCVEIRDAPGAPNYIDACVQTVNADSATTCQNNPTACLAPWVGKWVWMRGTVRKTTAHPGGYKVNLTSTGPHAANPALLGGGQTSVASDAAWQAKAEGTARDLIVDGDLSPYKVPAEALPAAAKARFDASSGTPEISVVEAYILRIDDRPLYLVLATDGSGEGGLVAADLIDFGGAWFEHGTGHTVWDGGGFSWGLDNADPTICKCGADQQVTCTWLDGTTSPGTDIACE